MANDSNLPNSFGDLTLKTGANSSRLPSFKAPRDLSLSSTTAAIKSQITRPKKTFTPNIPIRREKGEKLPECKSTVSQKRPNRNKLQVREKNVKREKEFIQTQGSLFGDGIANSTFKRSSFYGGHSNGKGNYKDKMFIQKPLLNTNAAYNIDKELEDKKLRQILRDDFIDDSEDDVAELYPVRLPMVTTQGFKEQTDLIDPIKKLNKKLDDDDSDYTSTKLKVKQEPQISDDDSNSEKGQFNSIKVDSQCNKKLPNEYLVPEILSESNNDIMFFQEIEENSQTNSKCSLASLPEGRLGTLRIYESGKSELWLGNHKLNIETGTQVGFLQDVVNISTDKEKKSGSFSVLGHIKHRLVCTPDFDTMVKEQ